MRKLLIPATAAVLLCLATTSSEARRHSFQYQETFCGDRYCGKYDTHRAKPQKRAYMRFDKKSVHRAIRHGKRELREGWQNRHGQKHRQRAHKQQVAVPARSGTVVAHPEGCPRRSFCGCGTSLFLLGKVVTQGGLAIAANWLRFPLTDPAPRMAAVRRGHVFAIIKVLGGNKVLAYDPNSGNHKTRIHIRSLAGYRVVNPRAKLAEL